MTVLAKISVMISLLRRKRHEALIDRYGDKKKVVYASLTKDGYYLPPINSPAVTREYLLKVSEGDAVAKQRQEVIHYPYNNFSKEIAFCLLEEACELEGIELGFNIDRMPPKKWMVAMAYTLQPENPAFISRERLNELGRLAANFDQWNEGFADSFRAISSHEELKQRYSARLKAAYKKAIKNRLHEIARRYNFCAVDLNSPLIN